MAEISKTVAKLCRISEREFLNPYTFLDWPERLDGNWWFFSPQLISLYGSDHYERLTDEERQRLSLYEAVNFFSLNIHGEKALVAGMAQRLYLKEHREISPYLHHFLDEENKHMVYFAGFCTKYVNKLYPDKKMMVPREYAPGEEDFLFFAKILIFEEIVDEYNLIMAKDERLAPVVRQINRIHHVEESRHLAFGRELVKRLHQRCLPQWGVETRQAVKAALGDYISATLREYYNPEVYRDSGLTDPYGTYQDAMASQQCRARGKQMSRRCVSYLVHNGILEREPA
jgi:hypothetical protein